MDPLSLLPQHHQQDFDSRYRIVLIAAQRAKQLVRSGDAGEKSRFIKETSRALEEVLQGQVPYLKGEDAKQAIREVRQASQRPIDLSVYAQPDENAQEIKKELSVYIDDSAQAPVAEPETEES